MPRPNLNGCFQVIEQLQKLANIGHLSSGIFHDIINPLTVVNLSLEQMKDNLDPLPPETQDYIQQALKASNRIQELIESSNNYLRKKSQNQSFSIHQEILQIVKIMNAKARKNNVIIEVNTSEDICIKGGPARFGQVIMNLLANAIEASPNKKHESVIIINIKRDQVRENIIVEVVDKGIGISEENLNKIFTDFFSTKKLSGHNTGIGLHLVKNIIVEDFNGKIEVKSKINKGTTFTIFIPSSYECY